MGIRANGNLGHLLARRQKLLEKHDLAFLQGKTLKKGFKRYTKCGTISWENRTRSLKVENKQRAMKMGIRANGNLGQHFQKQATKWDPILSKTYYRSPDLSSWCSKNSISWTILFFFKWFWKFSKFSKKSEILKFLKFIWKIWNLFGNFQKIWLQFSTIHTWKSFK